jgi:hypothetical protein
MCAKGEKVDNLLDLLKISGTMSHHQVNLKIALGLILLNSNYRNFSQKKGEI